MSERAAEQQGIRELVRRAGSVRAAAAELGVTRQALYQRIEKLGGTVLTTSEVVFPAEETVTPAGATAQ